MTCSPMNKSIRKEKFLENFFTMDIADGKESILI